MLIDSRVKETETSKAGFNPNVQNNQIPAVATGGQKALFWIFAICTIGIFAIVQYIGKGNLFKRLQVKVNESSSNIDVQLKKRRDTLIKLVAATQSSFKYERSLLTDITQLRTMNNFNPNSPKGAQASGLLNNTFSRMLATFENYPQLQSIQAVREMMQVADMTEREIAASRRLYNAAVTEFNEIIYVWPAVVVANSHKLYNLALFAASEEDRKDVSFNIE